MKEYRRKDPRFSLCGLNCALCTMHLGGYCPGCGGGKGNQPCKLLRCAGERGVEYCWQCGEYPCEKYRGIDEYDSFITHQAMLRDAGRAKKAGLPAYLRELEERAAILQALLAGYNDGRRKTLFSTAAVLLDVTALRQVMEKLGEKAGEESAVKERAALAAELLQAAAQEQGVLLKLKKKPKEIGK